MARALKASVPREPLPRPRAGGGWFLRVRRGLALMWGGLLGKGREGWEWQEDLDEFRLAVSGALDT